MRGFAEHTLPHVQAHLILAGSTVHAITDDPEEPEALDEVQAAWRALGHQQRAPGDRRMPADARHRGECRDRERAPTSRRRDRQEEPRGGLRAWSYRGAMEATRRSSPAMSAVIVTRFETSTVACWSIRPTSAASVTRSQNSSPTRDEPARLATPDTKSSSSSTSTAGSSPNGTSCSPPSPSQRAQKVQPASRHSKSSAIARSRGVPAEVPGDNGVHFASA